MPLLPKPAVQVGDTITGVSADGHRMTYRVTGFWPDGAPKTSSWDARHDPECACITNPEAWY